MTAVARARGAARVPMIDMHAHCLPRISRAEAHGVDAERAP